MLKWHSVLLCNMFKMPQASGHGAVEGTAEDKPIVLVGISEPEFNHFISRHMESKSNHSYSRSHLHIDVYHARIILAVLKNETLINALKLSFFFMSSTMRQQALHTIQAANTTSILSTWSTYAWSSKLNHCLLERSRGLWTPNFMNLLKRTFVKWAQQFLLQWHSSRMSLMNTDALSPQNRLSLPNMLIVASD